MVKFNTIKTLNFMIQNYPTLIYNIMDDINIFENAAKNGNLTLIQFIITSKKILICLF